MRARSHRSQGSPFVTPASRSYGRRRSTEWSSPVEGWPRPGTAELPDGATVASDGEPGTHRSPGVSSPVGPVRRCAGDRASLPSPNPSANSVGGCRGRNGEPPPVATPQTELKHAHELFTAPRARRRLSRIRSGLLVGAAAALTVTALPGSAAAAPGDSAAQTAQLVADASHQLEVVTEQVNEAKVQLDQQQAAVTSADQAAAAAQAQLDAFDGQIRQIARSAYTGDATDGLPRIDMMLSSSSADEFVHQLGTLDAIAGHTNAQVAQVAQAAAAAKKAQATATEAQATAQKTYDDIAAQQKDLQAKIADYQRQYASLTAPQQQQVVAAHGDTQAVPSGVVAPSGAAQKAVDTALAQVGDPYVWGASGPDAFDCSGLTQYAYSAAGVSLPHSSSSQSRMGTPVSRDQLQPGDLVFFYSPVSHVGMYIGNGQMVHASTSGQPVKVASLDSMGSYNSARRDTGG